MTAIQYYLIFIMSGHIKTMSILGKAELKMYFGENSIRLLALKKTLRPAEPVSWQFKPPPIGNLTK